MQKTKAIFPLSIQLACEGEKADFHSLYSSVDKWKGIYIGGVFPFSHADEDFDTPEDFMTGVFVCTCVSL